MTADEVVRTIAAELLVRDDIARAEVKGSEVYAMTQGGTAFRVLVIWPQGQDSTARMDR